LVVTTTIVFETHSITEDNEGGFATGWMPGRRRPGYVSSDAIEWRAQSKSTPE
jgi:hypothetical protein